MPANVQFHFDASTPPALTLQPDQSGQIWFIPQAQITGAYTAGASFSYSFDIVITATQA
jgi:hypothetical protein